MRRPLLMVLAAYLALPIGNTVVRAEESEPAAAEQAAAPSPAARFDEIRREQIDADKEARHAQDRIDALDDKTQKMLSDYRRALAEAESYEAYAAQLGEQIASQQQELATNRSQLEDIEATAREITPLEQRMLATLSRFVELDVPFLLEERRGRVATLQSMMGRADVSISEKYRRILEAYQIELDYGRTIETYEARLTGGEQDRTVRFLRVGRVSLLYQTLDGGETGYWNQDRRTWVVDDGYVRAFKEGVAVASKTSAPEMLTVPVPSPQESKS